MGVSTFVQPNFPAQLATEYKTAIDDAVAVHHQIGGAFAPHEQTVPNLTVRLDAANFSDLVTRTTITHAAQDTGALSAPSVNPRKDIIFVDRITGDVGVATGAEAASPVDPTIPVGKLPVARINWTISTTEITNTDLDDIRAIGSLGLSTAAFINVGTTDGLIPTLNVDGGQTWIDTDDGAGSGPHLDLYRNSASPAASDVLGFIRLLGESDIGVQREYAGLFARILDASNGLEDAELLFRTIVAGTGAARMTLAQGLQLGSPTDGDKGVGTGNFENGLFIDGAEVIAGGVAVIDRDMSENDVVDTASETTLYSFSVPANTLGTNKVLRVSLRGDYLNNSGATKTLDFKIKYGTTTLVHSLVDTFANDADRQTWTMDFLFGAVDSASVQIVNGTLLFSKALTPTIGIGSIFSGLAARGGGFQGTAAEDSTGALALTITVKHSAAHANTSFRAKIRIIELL